ncbi:MAG: hypothetical protein DRP15_02085, partial [Candidatus Aenigmatarchaeota archaeon]
MRWDKLCLGIVAILVSYLVASLPLVVATNVNIIFNGNVQATAEYNQENLVNKIIYVTHDPSDISWANPRVVLTLSSASLAHSIRKIYVYKCGGLSPVDCVRTEPQVFDEWVDTEFAWRDISQQTGPSRYPQVANLLIFVKLEDMNGKTSWIGFWEQITRTNYNIFSVYSNQIDQIDVYAKSQDLIEPIRIFIENKVMIPFNWLERVVFNDATTLYAVGASESEIETPQFQTAQPSSNDITAISKDYYFILPYTLNGLNAPVTLNLNPSFSCGDGVCEYDLGETETTCCYDCGCSNDYYCDAPQDDPISGRCKDPDEIYISSVTSSTDKISECSGLVFINISINMNSAPVSVSRVSGSITFGDSSYPMSCSGGPLSYDCRVRIPSPIGCGTGSYNIGSGHVNLTIEYYDGPTLVSKSLSKDFSELYVEFDCGCPEGRYCDTGSHECESEDAITLGITNLTSYLDNYRPGDTINLTAKIFNPPTGLVLVSTSASLNLSGGHVSPGTPQCVGPTTDYEYFCRIPFQIEDYSDQKSYTFQPNTLTFTITYNDGAVAKTKTLSTGFGPISIPSQFCGDGNCNMGETQDSCCYDCGCPSDEQFCDVVSGCVDIDSVQLSVDVVTPKTFKDCRVSHLLNLTLGIANSPYHIKINRAVHYIDDKPSGWSVQCDDVLFGVVNCYLTIPPIENCSLPYYEIGPNSIELQVTFPDGSKPTPITKTLKADFDNVQIIPTYHCGDGVCESDLLENASNCCIDCPCESDASFGEDYYCNYDPVLDPTGTCTSKENITLVIDSPTSPVTLSSCEIHNKVSVLAHVENQPYSMRVKG